jgi:hypothetical protein
MLGGLRQVTSSCFHHVCRNACRIQVKVTFVACFRFYVYVQYCSLPDHALTQLYLHPFVRNNAVTVRPSITVMVQKISSLQLLYSSTSFCIFSALSMEALTDRGCNGNLDGGFSKVESR